MTAQLAHFCPEVGHFSHPIPGQLADTPLPVPDYPTSHKDSLIFILLNTGWEVNLEKSELTPKQEFYFHRSPQQATSRPSFFLPLVGLLEDSDLDLPSLDDLFSPVQERRDVTISSGSATVDCGSGSYRPSLSQKVLISTTRNF